MAVASASVRKESTPESVAPGIGGMNGREPVAMTRLS
jgi:hypothetical protein